MHKKMNMIKVAMSLIMIVSLLFSLSVFPHAKEPQKIIKVGYFDYKNFSEKNNDGTTTGYAVDYLNEISNYTDWKYEFLHASWEECMEMLKNKEIDLLCAAQYTKERDEIFDFSRHPIGTVQATLYTKSDNQNLYYEDFKSLNGKSIAAVAGSKTIDLLNDYAQRHNFTYHLVECKSSTEINNMLLNDEIEIIAEESIAIDYSYKTIGKFGSDPFYFMSYEDNDIMYQIDLALDQIKSYHYDFEQDLYNKYFGEKIPEKPNFTREEIEFIKQSDIITIGNLPNKYPVSNYDEKNNRITGITADIMHRISRISGLYFSLKPIGLKEKPIEALKSQQFDLIAGAIENNYNLQDPCTTLSTPFLKCNTAVVGKKGSLYHPNDDLTIVIPTACQSLEEHLKYYYPNFTIIKRDTNEDCLNALIKNQANFMFQNIYVMSYLLQNPRYSELDIVPAYLLDEDSCIAALKTTDPRLISIINKTIQVIDEDVINQIIVAHTITKPYKLTVSDIIYKHHVSFIIILFLFILCIGLFLFIIIFRQHDLSKLKKINTQLTYAIKEAKQANNAKSLFLSKMSHEIRTPMNAIVGLTTIAKKNVNNSLKVSDCLESITNSSKLLLNIINDVLDMSAIESQKMKIANKPFDFKQLISSISEIYYPQCKLKNIDFDLILTDVTEETLIGDSLRINQILMNLLSNALKFTESGGSIKLTISKVSQTKDKVFFRFSVFDTGCGMSEEMKKRIFLPFEQESETTALKYGGSGLGLAITKSLIDLMDGSITLKTKKGEGTTFHVDLPLQINKSTEINQPNKFQNIHVLIVDDDKDACEYTSIILNRMGIAHDCAHSGNEAIKMLLNSHEKGKGYDICFVDWKMPKVDGVTVTEKIRETFDEDSVIIIVSAYDKHEIEEEAKEAGANMFISKPMFQSTIFNVLMSLGNEKYTQKIYDNQKYDFTGHRLLLAEDNTLNSEIAVEILSMVNLKVDTAENGKVAFEMFTNSAPYTYDVVLLDIQMPFMNGYDTAKAIRASKHPQAKEIPILAFTANAFTEDIALAISAGMNGHIAKPIDTDVLYSTLQNFFKEQ